MMQEFNEDYYERGVETGVSCYSNYRWMPELTIPLAFHLARTLGIQMHESVLDYGCAKGYLVKAFKLLGFRASGCDVSAYALDHAPEDVRGNLFYAQELFVRGWFDWVISKDVLEHVPYDEIDSVLYDLRRATKKGLFVVVPLGAGGRYIIDAYELDKTHVIRESLEWWVVKLQKAGFDVESAVNRVHGVKDNWAQYEEGNGFILAR